MGPGYTADTDPGQNQLTAAGLSPKPQRGKKADTEAYVLHHSMYEKQPEKEKFRDRELGCLNGD